ncbi:MAG: MFS transporter [Chloroflexi bacterium]|nr:MFS transporter [Chloroflexota bacterium]
MTESSVITGKRPSWLPALGYPQYRLIWFSLLGTSVGRWIETVVVAWLVLELTNSPFLVGLLGTCRFASMVLGPFCGAVCDRFNRRFILLTAQIAYGTASLIVLALFSFRLIEVWHLFVFTIVGGICYTFDFATRYTVVTDIIKSHHIVSAASLLHAANGITSIVGPLLGGGLLESIGASGSFVLISACFVFSLVTLLKLRVKANPVAGKGESIWSNLASGLRYIREDRVLFSLVLVAAVVNLFVFPYSYTLMPIFARDVLNTGASGFGMLMAAIGAGALTGSFVTGVLPPSMNRSKLLIVSLVFWPVILVTFALSESFYLSMILLIVSGLVQGVAMVLIQALLLIRSTEAMRGRVAGARALAISTLSLGALLTGYEARLWGAPAALIINASVYVLFTAFVLGWASGLFGRRPSPG